MTTQDLPQRTQAIVVGVETYAVGSEWNLNGPASDACRFVKLLRRRGALPEQIMLFVSALPENQSLVDQLDVEVKPAQHALVTDAVTNKLAGMTGDLLVFFWGGHGVIDARKSRRLFCADATRTNPRHISLNSLLTTWQTDTIGLFPRQIGFVDACQNYLEFMRDPSTMPEDVLPAGNPIPGVEQFFLLAASPGELAKNLAEEKSGAFSLALFEQLEKPDAEWPPDMEGLNQNLMKCFAELRDAGQAEQTPSHFWYRDWNGGEGTMATLKRPSSAKQAFGDRVGPEERFEIVDALLEFEAMVDTEYRKALISDLRREIKFNTKLSGAARSDVDNLVRTALRYPGGLKELARIVELHKGADEIAWQNLRKVLANVQ